MPAVLVPIDEIRSMPAGEPRQPVYSGPRSFRRWLLMGEDPILKPRAAQV